MRCLLKFKNGCELTLNFENANEIIEDICNIIVSPNNVKQVFHNKESGLMFRIDELIMIIPVDLLNAN